MTRSYYLLLINSNYEFLFSYRKLSSHIEDATKIDDFKSLFKYKKSRNFTGWVIGITIVLIVLFIVINQLLCIKEFDKIGNFFNGIAAPVLSLITIILLYNSFLVQKEELKTASDALKQSVEEMKNSAAIMERTEQNAKLERLESIVFKLLEKYENSRDNFVIDNNKGINAFKTVKNTLLTLCFTNAIAEQHYSNLELKSVKERDKLVDKLINAMFNTLKKEKYYNDIQSLIYKFIAVYKCILHSNIPSDKLDYLRFAINNHLTKEEMLFVKLFINQLDDLSNLRTELDPFIHSSSGAIYEQHIND